MNESTLDRIPMTEILGEAGYDITLSINGHNAMGNILQEKYDLLIFDLESSELSAYEVLSQLKTIFSKNSSEILFLTKFKEVSSYLSNINNNNIRFLSRPFIRQELFKAINNQLKHRRTSKELEKKRQLMSSLSYAFEIQKSLLPDDSFMNQVFSDHFVLNLPLDGVSGDFYWVKKIDDTILFALADCTGHGVPGALLSVLGISLLNEISSGSMPEGTNELLENLRKKFIQSLLKTDLEKNDLLGMDMVLGLIDLNTKVMSFSGANNSLFIRRDGKIIEIKGDPQPVGFFPEQKPFKSHTVSLMPGDEFYAASDGYQDQFGGSFEKKLQKRNLKKIIQSVGNTPMKQQKLILHKKHLEWKGSCEQVDDILVMGFKI